MLVPSMLNMADVMADSGFTEEEVFDCGISGRIIFLVVVPLIGACRVPVEALSHFMAGADDYAAEGMPEHWSGALSGKWTIKRDRLRILPQSWEAFSDNLYKLAEALDAASEPKEADAPAVKVEAGTGATPAPVTQGNKLRRNHLDPAIDKAIKQAGNMELADVYLELKELALAGEKPFTGAIDGDALCYTDENNQPEKFTKNALGKRLKNRR